MREKLHTNLTQDQINITNALLENKKVMVLSCHNCLHKDAMVTLSDGTYLRSEELVGKHFDILTLNDKEEIVSAKAECYYVEDSEMYKITTESGRVFLRNHRHPFWKADIVKKVATITKVNVAGWTRIHDLKVGDHIAVTELLPAFGNNSINEDEIKFIAYMIGDGYCSIKNGPQFVQVGRNAQLLDFADTCINLGISMKTADEKHWILNEEEKLTSKLNPAKDLLKKHGLDNKLSSDKSIPSHFFNLEKEQLRLFLNRLFSTDGWYYYEKPSKRSVNGRVEVGFCSCSEKLVRDVNQLCIRFGINGKVRYKSGVNAWIYEINQSKEVIKFIEEIGIYGKEEKEAVTLEIATNLFNSKSVKYRNKKAPNNTRWEKITSIEPLGVGPTVNIEVPEWGRYLTEAYDKNSGKCLAQNEWVYLADGKKVRAKTLVGKEFDLLTVGAHGLVKVKGIADWNEEEEIYEVVTESGRKLTVNKQHPLWAAIESKTPNGYVLYPQGWTKIKNLRRGDLVAVTKEFPAFGNRVLPRVDIELLPYILVNTFVEDLDIIALNKSFSDQPNPLIEALEPYCKFHKYSRDNNSRLFIEDTEGKIAELYNNYRISDSFKHRRIPNEIFELSKEDLAIFIKGLFKSNVLLIKNDDESKIKFYHRSEEFIRDLSFILLKFGISSKVYQKENKDFWVLRVLNIQKFLDNFDGDGNLDYMGTNNPDEKLNWRYEDVPTGTYWEKIKEINYIGEDWTVAISVPVYQSYLTDFFQHNSYLAGGLTNWNYDAFGDSITLTAGPSGSTVRDTTWREIRSLRRNIPEELWDLAPVDTRMQNSESHFAAGFVAGGSSSSRGRKSERMLLIFDEADGIPPHMWQGARGMLFGPNNFWLVLLNPVDITSQAKVEYDNGAFTNIHISALNHPNVLSDLLTGEPKARPFPGITTDLNWVNDWVFRECRRIEPQFRKSYDIEWPPRIVDINGEKFETHKESFIWRPKPGSDFEPRVMGQWPSNTDVALWNDAMWLACLERQDEEDAPVEIGCDPAGMGKDSTAIHIRRGRTCLDHEKHYGLDTREIADHLKALASKWGGKYGMRPQEVIIRIDSTGSTGVYDQRGDYNFIKVISSMNALKKDLYPNRRSELWFEAKERAEDLIYGEDGQVNTKIDLSRLKNATYADALTSLKKQLQGARFYLRALGKKEVEKKEELKKRIKESPDDADAFNLAFSEEIEEENLKTRFTSGAIRTMNKHFGRRNRR